MARKRKSRIYIRPSRRGSFTAKAKRKGMGVQAFARYVLSHKKKFSKATIKQAVFARNARKFKH